MNATAKAKPEKEIKAELKSVIDKYEISPKKEPVISDDELEQIHSSDEEDVIALSEKFLKDSQP